MTTSRALALLALLASPVPMVAQTPGYDHAVVEVPAGTQAMAMGGAFDLSSRDSDALFHNPATLTRADGFALGLLRFGDAGTQLTASAATPWWDGTVAVGVQTLEWGAGSADGSVAGGVDRILGDGSRAVAEWAASVGYARELFGPSVGVVGKLVGQRAGPGRDVVAAVDVGVASELGPLWVGLVAQNLSGEALGDDGGPMGERITLGAGRSGIVLGPLDVGAAARLTRRADGELVPGGGVEVAYWPIQGRTFLARAGFQRVPEGAAEGFSLGAGFRGDDLVLEYAYQPIDGLDGGDGLHRITVGWR